VTMSWKRALPLLYAATVGAFALFLWWYVPPLDESEPPPPARPHTAFDFQENDAIPFLYQAAVQPPEEGVKLLLHSSAILRYDTAREIERAAAPDDPLAKTHLGDPALEAAIDRKIDELIRTKLETKELVTSAILPITPIEPEIPINAIYATRDHRARFAAIALFFPPGVPITAETVPMVHGRPTSQTHDEFRYETRTKSYTSTIVFKVGLNGVCTSVTVSVERHLKKG